MSEPLPTKEDLAQALFDTIDGNDYDDGLNGYWSSEFIGGDEGSNTYRIEFLRDDEGHPEGERAVATWELTIKIKEVKAGE